MQSNGFSSQILRYDNQVAIVTGAGAGMGATHAILLGQRGAKVVVNDLLPETAENTVKEIKQAGGTALAVAGNIADPAVAEMIVQAAMDEYGRIDILINNAGIEIKKNFGDFTAAEFRRMMDVHVFGTWTLTNLCWQHMKKQGYGKILVVSSNSLFGMKSNAAYATAKGALFGLMKSLAMEGREFGITVNALGPIASTAMSRQMSPSQEQQAWLEQTAPAWMTSPVVAWLVHKDCDTTGEMISAYGFNFGRVFIAETPGACIPDEEWTPEVVRDHFHEGLSEQGYLRASSTGQLMKALFQLRSAKMSQPKKILDED